VGRNQESKEHFKAALWLSSTPSGKYRKVKMLSGSSQPVTQHLRKGKHMKKQIDLSDIPETKDWNGASRGLFTRAQTAHISIRLSTEDLALATKLAVVKGLPYQTYIKSLLHEALQKAASVS
jgi:predicted DNA binding CopG/RHH family protein